MTSGYDNNHRAFLQAFLSHSSLTLSAARPILAAIQTAHDPDRPTLPNDVTNEDILSHIHTVNSAITAFDLEIRSAKPQTHDAASESQRRESESESIAGHAHSGERVYALVNASADPAAQLATTYTAEELAYIKRVLDAMFDTYNTRRAELCAVTGIQAAQLHKAPRNNGTANGRESTAASGLSQSGQAQSIAMSQAERVLASLVEAGWFNRSKKGFYTLSARGLMELRGWLVDTYNEPADEGEGEDAVEKVKSCHACKEIVIVGQRCPTRDCSCRLHDFCVVNFFQMQRSRTCPICKVNWEGHGWVGEKAASDGASARRTALGSRRTTAQAVDSDEED